MGSISNEEPSHQLLFMSTVCCLRDEKKENRVALTISLSNMLVGFTAGICYVSLLVGESVIDIYIFLLVRLTLVFLRKHVSIPFLPFRFWRSLCLP